MGTDDAFNPARSPLAARMAVGHLARTGHALAGFYTYDGNMGTLHRTCACAVADDADTLPDPVLAVGELLAAHGIRARDLTFTGEA